MALKKVPFTEAREALSALIDEVRDSGRPIAITRHGKAVALLMNIEAMEQKLTAHEHRVWNLRGSGAWQVGESDLTDALQAVRQQASAAMKERIKNLTKDLSEQ